MQTCFLIVIAVLLQLTAGLALADDLKISINSMPVVADSVTGQQASILQFDMNEELSGKDIHSAKLIVKPQFEVVSRRFVEVTVYPIADEAEGNVNLLSDGRELFLDVENGTHEYIDTEADGTVAIDLTHWLQCWADGDCANLGLCVVSETPLGQGLTLDADAVESGAGQIVITYRNK